MHIRPATIQDNDELQALQAQQDRQEQMEVDLLVLSTGMEPDEDRSIASILKLPLNRDGFLLEAHAKLRPLDFATDGVFVCG